ncbi:hypothetical protein [Shewanella sp. TC10]|uniref:hypothetical protein n=1 Tax=Shewanella sp. TC10 TaxID=1419739 RepID=UPI00129DBCCD|nr:hypothetical protein [Shewanella sp. TC10]
MQAQSSLSVIGQAVDLAKTDSSHQAESAENTEKFSDVLSNVTSVASVGSAVLATATSTDIFSVDNLKQQILSETGLDNENILSLNMNASMISELQQGLLSSLQTSMVKSSAIANVVSQTQQVTESINTKNDAANLVTSDNSSLVDDIYSYSFGEDGFDEKDIIDSVNILNHTPILSYIYQETTNTEISPASTLAGSVLYSDYVGTGSTAIKLIMDYFSENNSEVLAAGVSSFLSSDSEENNN